MTARTFRRIALSLPEAVEGSHMEHPDFRAAGRIFATLFSADGLTCGMVKLTPPQQRRLVSEHPGIFEPVKGGWGRKGATQVNLRAATTDAVRGALLTAWLNIAPKRLTESPGADHPEEPHHD